jgi:hypothetical protein
MNLFLNLYLDLLEFEIKEQQEQEQEERIHKGTWKIPGSEQTNQTDHVLVSRRHGSSILDVKTARGPNSDSDHYLVKVKIKDRLAKIDNNISYKRQNGKLTNERNQNSVSYIRKQ